MANLTSLLTLKLTDLLSGPAGEAAAALKKFGISAQDLQKSAKFDSFRQLQQSFAKARAEVTATQQKMRDLAAQFEKQPSKNLETALQRAANSAVRAKAAFEQQSAAIIASKAGLQSLGVPLNQIVTEEGRLKTAATAATVAMEQQAAKAQSIGARIRRGMGTAFGNIAPFLGPPMLAATYKAVKAGAAIDSSQMGLRVAGIPETEIARITKSALKQQALYPQLSINEILDSYKEARSLIPKAEDAERLLPVLAQTAAALKGLEHSGKVEAGSTQGLGFALKAAEVLGAAQNPKRLEAYLDAFVKASQVKGNLINPEQIYAFMAGLKTSGALLSDRFLHGPAMSLAAELKGGKAGSGINAFVKTIAAPSGEQAKEFLELGLMSPSDFKPPQARGGFGRSIRHSTNKLGETKLGAHVVGWELAQTDPDKWVQKWLLPALKQKKGITDLPSIIAIVEKLFPDNAANIVAKLITQADTYREEAFKMRASLGLAATEAYKDDAPFQLETLKQAFSTFGGVLTSPTMTSAAHVMNYVARTFAEWADSVHEWNEEHPGPAKAIGRAAITVGTVGGVGLSYGLVRGLMGGFGLGKSALALDGSAAALTRAAVALGASSRIPGGVPGGVPGVVPVAVAATLKGVATGALTAAALAGVELAVEAALYDALVPEATKKEIKRRSDAIDAMKPAPGTTKAEILRRNFNADRARLGIPLIGSAEKSPLAPTGDIRIPPAPPTAVPAAGFRLDGNAAALAAAAGLTTAATKLTVEQARAAAPTMMLKMPADATKAPATAVPAAGFRLDAGPERATKASPGDFSNPLAPGEGYRIPLPRPRPAEISAAPSVVLPDQTAEAAAAGHSFAKAFVDSFGEELLKAPALAAAVASQIIGHLTFSASPDVTPQAAGAGAPPAGGQNAHGLFSDYGIRP